MNAINNSIQMDYDLEIAWIINEFCNFDCVYCFDQNDKRKTCMGSNDIVKIVEAFNRLKNKCLICISGGEPFFYPNFTDLCAELTKKHYISIVTNLSSKHIYRFAEVVDPIRVGSIHCSVHIQERSRLRLVNDFIDKYNHLKSKGFYVFASYVMYPHLLKRFQKDYKYFKSEGIILKPKIYKGQCGRFTLTDAKIFRKIRNAFGRWYPKGYSVSQKNRILAYINQSQDDEECVMDPDDAPWRGRLPCVYFDRYLLGGLPSFKGKYCYAGKSSVRMHQTGEVCRCHNEDLSMGNLFDGNVKLLEEPMKCKSDVCFCAEMGYRHALQNDHEYKESNDKTKQN